jgi:MinD-like ATPase involved in chromosome partitioning or flagellar assembly
LSWRTWLDASPVAQVALALMRDATGREEPLVPLTPARPAGLPPERGVAFWSLTAGVGASTVAALVAHRSASAARAPVLIDLDRRVPTLGLRAKCAGATVADALLRPGSESGLLSRWGEVPFLPGTPELYRSFDGARIAELVGRLHRDRAAVVDLGCGAESLDADVLGVIDRLCLVVGPGVAQLQSAFCAVPLLQGCGVRVGVVVVGAEPDDATRIAARLPWMLLAAIPRDPFLANDEFATRSPTLRAVDAAIRGLA